ncbi:VanZ family protein [Gottfriedia acidiceleris]|uniref:VanZ family protein n=1 Tax=Gottfriedia acidiceleris TaxID=371036 RepID=A0ABY4JR11_9BACI|nr:VanZ family protein [Gottfriedia acidiceleris]UPM54725.1 VanZ family protein [Gottfriedia acidiceleris]
MKPIFIKYLLLISSLVFIFRFTFFPVASLGIGVSEGRLNLIPLIKLFNEFSSIKQFIVNVFGNIILFVPFGFILTSIKSSKKVILIGLFLSVSIEVVQFMMSFRTSDIDDVILNTIGTYIGYRIQKINLFKK